MPLIPIPPEEPEERPEPTLREVMGRFSTPTPPPPSKGRLTVVRDASGRMTGMFCNGEFTKVDMNTTNRRRK